MVEFNEDEFLMISGIQHFQFCPRQWALIHIEGAWKENVLTLEGKYEHEKVDQPFIREKRNDLLVVRSLPVHSRELGINGICDVVEFTESDSGVHIFNSKGKYLPLPIEYKHGKSKKDDSDILQVTAQAICLEEMLACKVDYGSIFYEKTRRRDIFKIDSLLRNELKHNVNQMHDLWRTHHTPKVKTGTWCNRCSIKDLCLPELMGKESVSHYILRRTSE